MNVPTWECRDCINQFSAQAGVRCLSTQAKVAGDAVSTELSYIEQNLTSVWELCLLKKPPLALSQHRVAQPTFRILFP